MDFADVRSIMENTGSALMGIGIGTGENRAIEAAKAAIDSPLLELSIEGAKGILFTISGGPDLGMFEVNEAAKIITEHADPNARVIFGSVVDETLGEELRVTVVATGFGASGRATHKIGGRTKSAFETEEPVVHARPSFLQTEVADEYVRRPESEPRFVRSNVVDDNEQLPRRSIEREQPPQQTEEDLEIPAFIRKKMM